MITRYTSPHVKEPAPKLWSNCMVCDGIAYIAGLTSRNDDGVTIDGKDVPVKLRVYDSLFVPMAKWSMLLTGNYRCVEADGVRPIRDAVHGDIDASKQMYGWVDALARQLGADPADQVPFEKYANARLSGPPDKETVNELISLSLRNLSKFL